MAYYSQKPRFGGGGGRRAPAGRGGSRGPKKAYIHPSKFVRAAKPRDEPDYVPTYQFSELGLNEKLKKNLIAKNILTPTPIQDEAILHGMKGKDVVGLAPTGTGKTMAFALPLIHRLMEDPQAKALIMAPTRELAQQIREEARSIGKDSGLFDALLIGGTAMGPQLSALRYGPRIVIGTPGRIKDHMERRSLDLAKFNIIVLDEVDRMLDMGFVNDMKHILGRAAAVRQSFFFSATMNPSVETLIKTFTKDAVTVSVKMSETSDNVEQDVVRFGSGSDKMDKLKELLSREAVGKTLVFGETKHGVERLSKELLGHGFAADSIHGGKSQSQRQRALAKFKGPDLKVLVATDVAARGIDVKNITHVVNYETPQSYQDYAHRIGRAGRAGKIGYAFTFIPA